MLRRVVIPLSIVLALGGSSSIAQAGGWQEMHETSDDVRVEIGPDGVVRKVSGLPGVTEHQDVLW